MWNSCQELIPAIAERIAEPSKLVACSAAWLYSVYLLAVLLVICCWTGVSEKLFSQDVSATSIELTRENYAAWRDHVAPRASDLKWQQIPWLTTFQEGILAANDTGKPLLFWTMNGHPLGCT